MADTDTSPGSDLRAKIKKSPEIWLGGAAALLLAIVAGVTILVMWGNGTFSHDASQASTPSTSTGQTPFADNDPVQWCIDRAGEALMGILGNEPGAAERVGGIDTELWHIAVGAHTDMLRHQGSDAEMWNAGRATLRSMCQYAVDQGLVTG